MQLVFLCFYLSIFINNFLFHTKNIFNCFKCFTKKKSLTEYLLKSFYYFIVSSFASDDGLNSCLSFFSGVSWVNHHDLGEYQSHSY